MIIFLYGPDSYRRQKKANSFIEKYRKEYSNLSLDYFDLELPDGLLRLKEFAGQLSIFDSKKLAILKNAFLSDVKDLREFLKKYLKVENLTILISEETLPQELKSLAAKAFLAEEFELLKGNKWEFFVKKEIEQRKINLSPQAAFFLSRTFEGDIWGLVNELGKISLFSAKKQIDTADLIGIGDYGYKSPDIFSFMSAVIKNWPLPQKVVELEKLFIAGEEPLKIFNIMASLKWLPKDLIRKVADYDVMMKSGKVDCEEVLVDLALANG